MGRLSREGYGLVLDMGNMLTPARLAAEIGDGFEHVTHELDHHRNREDTEEAGIRYFT